MVDPIGTQYRPKPNEYEYRYKILSMGIGTDTNFYLQHIFVGGQLIVLSDPSLTRCHP
jgi:Fe2+ transport system protein FeoA